MYYFIQRLYTAMKFRSHLLLIASLLCVPILTAAPAPAGMVASIGSVTIDLQLGTHIARDIVSLSADGLTLTIIRLSPAGNSTHSFRTDTPRQFSIGRYTFIFTTDAAGNITRIMRHSSGCTPGGMVIYPSRGVQPVDVFEL